MCEHLCAGLDAGSTLWKLGSTRDSIQPKFVSPGDFDAIMNFVQSERVSRINATGSRASLLLETLPAMVQTTVTEFEAWGKGAAVVAHREGVILPDHYLLVSIGTGTSILEVRETIVKRLSGTPLGGGTLLGLGRLLGFPDFKALTTFASNGHRDNVDLRIEDIYPNGVVALQPQLTASFFGRLPPSCDKASIAAALLGLVAESIAILCCEIARSQSIETVVCGGGTLCDNPVFEGILNQAISSNRQAAIFLRNGAFCGAVGAAFTDSQRSSVA